MIDISIDVLFNRSSPDSLPSFRAEVLRNASFIGVRSRRRPIPLDTTTTTKEKGARVKGHEKFPEPFVREKLSGVVRRTGGETTPPPTPKTGGHRLYAIPETGNRNHQRRMTGCEDSREQRSVSSCILIDEEEEEEDAVREENPREEESIAEEDQEREELQMGDDDDEKRRGVDHRDKLCRY